MTCDRGSFNYIWRVKPITAEQSNQTLRFLSRILWGQYHVHHTQPAILSFRTLPHIPDLRSLFFFVWFGNHSPQSQTHNKYWDQSQINQGISNAWAPNNPQSETLFHCVLSKKILPLSAEKNFILTIRGSITYPVRTPCWFPNQFSASGRARTFLLAGASGCPTNNNPLLCEVNYMELENKYWADAGDVGSQCSLPNFSKSYWVLTWGACMPYNLIQ